MYDGGPTPEQVDKAVRAVADAVRAKYDVVGAYLYGSRARGDHRPDSDVDVAFVLRDYDPNHSDFIRTTVDIAVDHLVEAGVDIQAVPIRLEYWKTPMDAYNPFFIEAIQREGIPLW